MITHIALFKLVHSNKETIDGAKAALAGLEGKVPQVRYFELGVNIVPSYRSYDLSLITKFDSLADLEAYQNHPAHVEVVKYMQGIRKSVVTVDYES